ncbi:hypothetical protein HYDPIDRAFT_112198 [Hydnomerulius pinastri MD-312]|uniref:Uncharacterized protein n=1 Tax=Hydnomerulius pinastri MD-312 TaxID=994086 RepID=A0A0C9W983_9AGAM|nr:hypothetical protein HYDPIDRAFT_112198 [Hydnomerulius pinastri MD-312]
MDPQLTSLLKVVSAFQELLRLTPFNRDTSARTSQTMDSFFTIAVPSSSEVSSETQLPQVPVDEEQSGGNFYCVIA